MAVCALLSLSILYKKVVLCRNIVFFSFFSFQFLFGNVCDYDLLMFVGFKWKDGFLFV